MSAVRNWFLLFIFSLKNTMFIAIIKGNLKLSSAGELTYLHTAYTAYTEKK